MNEIIGRRAKVDALDKPLKSILIASLVLTAMGVMFLTIGNTEYFNFTLYGILGVVIGPCFLAFCCVAACVRGKSNSSPNPTIVLRNGKILVLYKPNGSEVPLTDRIVNVFAIPYHTPSKFGDRYGSVIFKLEKRSTKQQYNKGVSFVADSGRTAAQIREMLALE